LYFPFANSPADLDGRLRKDFPQEFWSIFRTFEAYPRGDKYIGGNDTLIALSKASGPNKHRFTCKIGGRIINFNSDHLVVDPAVRVSHPPRWDWDNNEMVVATTTLDGIVSYNFQIAAIIAFGNIAALNGYPVINFLSQALELCDGIVTIIKRETARLLSERPP
jgi:hypothetical protein